MRAADAVVRRPGDLRRGRRRVFGTMTLLLWSAYLYLWLPVVTLLAWALGLRTAWTRWVHQVDALDVDSLVASAGVSLALAGSLLVWAEYNRWRFTGVERRRRCPDVTGEQIGESLGIAAQCRRALQTAAVATVDCRPDGTVLLVRPTLVLDRSSSADGPAAAGPSVAGPAADGPSVAGPAADGPSVAGPAAAGRIPGPRTSAESARQVGQDVG